MTEPTQLHAFADGELTPPEANALREALRHDSRTAAEVDAILNLKDLLAKGSLRHSNDEAWKACVGRLDGLDRNRRVEGFVGRYAWALCGAMFLFILSGRAAMRTVQGDSALSADIVGRSVAPVSPLNRAKSQYYEAILGHVGRNLDPTEIEIGNPVQGRVHDLPAAQIPMRDRKGDLVLTRVLGELNLQDTMPMPSNPGVSAGVADGENCLVWHVGKETWILNGARSAAALDEVASRLLNAR